MSFEVMRFAPEAETQQQNTFKLARDVKTLMGGGPHTRTIRSFQHSRLQLCFAKGQDQVFLLARSTVQVSECI